MRLHVDSRCQHERFREWIMQNAWKHCIAIREKEFEEHTWVHEKSNHQLEVSWLPSSTKIDRKQLAFMNRDLPDTRFASTLGRYLLLDGQEILFEFITHFAVIFPVIWRHGAQRNVGTNLAHVTGCSALLEFSATFGTAMSLFSESWLQMSWRSDKSVESERKRPNIVSTKKIAQTNVFETSSYAQLLMSWWCHHVYTIAPGKGSATLLGRMLASRISCHLAWEIRCRTTLT